MKRQRQHERDTEDDRLSDLPDCVLLYIMKFMSTKDAVQTCILSTRWKDLWKSLTNLKLHSTDFARLDDFRKFVSRVLSCRDGTISLDTLDFNRRGQVEPKILNRVMRYAGSHNVQQLTISVNLAFRPSIQFTPSIFSCKSLTFLKLSIGGYTGMGRLPKSLELPALESLHLMSITFTASDNDCANPFSGCKMLDTLVIESCSLEVDAKVLCISNSKLSSLTIRHYSKVADKIELSTPNLSSLTIRNDPDYQLSSCSPLFLEEVDIDVYYFDETLKTALVLISWLQVLVNVKIMTFSMRTLMMLNALSNPSSMRTQPPCFDRLKSLKVKMDSFPKLSDEEVSRIVEYLLQNSLQASVDIINC